LQPMYGSCAPMSANVVEFPFQRTVAGPIAHFIRIGEAHQRIVGEASRLSQQKPLDISEIRHCEPKMKQSRPKEALENLLANKSDGMQRAKAISRFPSTSMRYEKTS
jgi:hypothetical protein